jgi:hypothetical protein
LIEVDNLALIEGPFHAIKACPDDAAHPFRLLLIGQGYEHVSSAHEAELNDAEVGSMPCILYLNLVEAINITFLESIHGQLRPHLNPLGKLSMFQIDVALVYDFYSVRIGLDAVLVNHERRLSLYFVLWHSSHLLLKPYLLVSLLVLCLLKSHLLISLLLDLLLLHLLLLLLLLLLFQLLLLLKLLLLLLLELELFPLQLQPFLL